jgi:DNA-binding response OmpR family regulator
MTDLPRTVLLVEADPELRDRIGEWLERSSFEVLLCPGPSAPSYTCVVSTGRPCVLAKAADVVLLDLWLGSDSVLSGTTASELLASYVSSDSPVVVIDPGHDELLTFMDEIAARVEWPPERHDVVESVRVAIRAATPA